MTSRVGSLLVAGFLGAIALVAVVVIIILTDDGEANDSAVIVTSLREDDVVLLGNPTEIRVTVTDDEPITRISLFVDGEPIAADAQPVHDPAQGSYSASIPWQPVRLGFVTISITVQGLSGEESMTEFRVEVTDDANRLGSDPTVSATRVGGDLVVVDSPAEEAPGETEEEEQQASEQTGDGFLSIQTPAEGSAFRFSEDLQVEIVVFADGVGTLVGMTLFVDTVPIANVEGLQPLGDGTYSLTIPWEPTGEGTFDLEVVAVSDTNRRFDDRVKVTVGPEDENGEEEVEQSEEEEQAEAEIDLTPTAIDVGTGQSVVVTVTNLGGGDLVTQPVLISLTRASDGLVLDEAIVVLTLGAGRSTAVELPISLTEALDITVVVDSDDAIEETDEGNNTINARFEPPTRPDLVPQVLQLRPDGTVSVRVTNVGGSPAEPPIAVLIVLEGLVVEELAFEGPGPLAPQGTLDLFGTIVIEGGGTLSAIVDPANGIAESNDGNNVITITLSE